MANGKGVSSKTHYKKSCICNPRRADDYSGCVLFLRSPWIL